MEKHLKDLYYNVDSKVCFTGVSTIYKEAKKKFPNITRKDVQKYLNKQDTYVVHRPRHVNFPRNKVKAAGLYTHLEADICDFQKLKESNDGYAYALTVVDVASRQVFAFPLKTKSPKEVRKAFEKLHSEHGVYFMFCYTDSGKEFLGKEMQDFFKTHNIHHGTAKNQAVKASIVERFNRTLKERIYKYFTSTGYENRWIDVLPKIVKAINESVNRTTGYAPASINAQNFEKLFKSEQKDTKKPKFAVGNTVRISKHKTIFRKGYLPRFSFEVFKISKVLRHQARTTYKIVDFENEPIIGTFYQEELVPSDKESGIYRVDVLKKRKLRGKPAEVYVHFKGYQDKHDKWMPESDLLDLQS
ncbi:hypothetical protein L596_021154 [Steinernema carpocapsae]|uniref:Integrase catalytic domain-containing protein n=1 Tax=Steinernema carpocapsae TaxID=34508 RepID=A0A4U5MVN6_STECR|nr:hypothetical protein L596_021154 [Steinernema carpocapsae]